MSDPLKTASVTTNEQLIYEDQVCIKFANSTYQWVDIKLFRLADPRIADPAALALLLRHTHYPDSYAGAKATKSQHGPYRLDAITTDSFTIIDTASAEAMLRTWAEQYAPLDEIARDQVERELYPRVRTATCCYRLTDLGEESKHDWAEVVGSGGFHEFVLIDRRAGRLALVVATDD
jgi:hypothetical protein